MHQPIVINNQDAIKKLIAFIKAQAKARFDIDPDMMEEIMKALWQFARENGIRIEIINPDNKRIAYLGAGGVFVGAAIGYAVASIPGAVVGAVVGGVAGVAMAHVTLKMDPPMLGHTGPVAIDLL